MWVTLSDQDKQITDLKEELAPLKHMRVEMKFVDAKLNIIAKKLGTSWRQGIHQWAILKIHPT